LASVPNLIYRSPSGEIRSNPHLPTAEVRLAQENVRPDFDGLPLDRYLAPEPVLPLIAAHGCYHGKCAFCNVGYGDPLHYHPLTSEFIVEEIQRLKEKYNCHHIFFVDEAIPPRTLKRLGPALEGQGVNWGGAVRLEKALVPPLLEAISAGGCRMMLFGLESASEPIMQAMIKGTDRAEMSRVLHDVAAAGIWAHTFFFFGFPGETLDDAQKTVNFVYEHQKVIHSASVGAFLLEIYAPAYYFPEKFGITNVCSDPKRDLAIYFDYDLASGLDEATATHLSDKLIEQLPDKRYGQYYITDVYKFLYSSELHRQGKPLPPWIE
jgi:anaerobic magnesium-protoporphyrin IX monomethyl ester cyclase